MFNRNILVIFVNVSPLNSRAMDNVHLQKAGAFAITVLYFAAVGTFAYLITSF